MTQIIRVGHKGQTANMIEICSYCGLDPPIFAQNQMHRPIPSWSWQEAHQKKSCSPSYSIEKWSGSTYDQINFYQKLKWDVFYYRADSRFVHSQWEMALLCNDISHWLGANLESALYYTITEQYFDGLVQDCSNSSALALELLQSCTNPLILWHIEILVIIGSGNGLSPVPRQTIIWLCDLL